MKFISWNVNGIRACLKKGFEEYFQEANADIFCIQETKCQEGQVELTLPGYHQYWNSAVRKGYSGTAIFAKREPLSVSYGIGIEEHDQEGRVITLEYEDFYFVTVYTPNSQNELARLSYRMDWERDFLEYLTKLEERKPVVWCGDLNVAHQEIDLKNPKTNRKNAGLPMKRELALPRCWRVDLLILFGIFTQIRKEFIPGGLTVFGREKKTRGGELTISWFLRLCGRKWWMQRFTHRC